MASDYFGLLEEPGLSRQWVLRRLQRALTFDLATAALKAGIASGSRSGAARNVADLATSTSKRAGALASMIEHEGGAPYSSVGLSRALARVGGFLLGVLGQAAWLRVLRRLAQHALSEYDGLAAMLKGAQGVSPELATAVSPLVRDARAEMELLESL